MSLSTVDEEMILNLLKAEGSTTIVLVGEPGSGKTWLARNLSALAAKKNKSFHFILWLLLNREYDSKALYQSIARQLSLFPTHRGLEDDDNLDIEEEQEEAVLDVLQKKISEALAKNLLEKKKILLVLDDEGNKMKEEAIINLLPAPLKKDLKVLITSVNKDAHVGAPTKVVIEVKPLTKDESISLLRQRAGSEAFEFPGVEALADGFAERSKGHPAAIIILSKALSYFCKLDSGVQTLERALKEVDDGGNPNFIHLLCSAHDMLPSSIMVDCAWSGAHFYRDRGSVHYNELITYWILEGYLGRIDCVEKAYEEGHRILMDLIDCGLLKKVERDCVNMERSAEAANIVRERAMPQLNACHRSGFDGMTDLGLADFFDIGGFGRITQADGMIRTPRGGKKGKKLSTALLDGSRLSREVLNKFCESNLELHVLAIFNHTLESLPPAFYPKLASQPSALKPTLASLPPALSYMKDLDILVLRGCDFLVNIEHIRELSKLTVLEISGASSLVKIPDDLFTKMTQLQSLHISSLQIKSMPESFFKLSQLHRLLLKDCPRIVKLKPLAKNEKLAVLNLSGATSLEEFPCKSFHTMPELRTLDLSNTKIKNLPVFGGIEKLTHISLRDCPRMDRLRSISSLTRLEVLDISGAKEFVEIQDESFEGNAALNIIDLSGTKVQKLPANIGNPHHLYLKGCSALKKLPYMEALEDLEAFYISGAPSLEIDDKFFENLRKLRILSISDTKIESLPSLSNLYELRQLLVSRCSSLVKLPQLKNLAKLEVLDLSGCGDLKDIQAESFDQMTCLRTLILSGTKIKELPSFSNLIDLRALLLNNCSELKKLPSLGSLSKLEELNLCGVTCLGRTGADFLKDMDHLRILDLSETNLEELPPMSKLTNLIQLFLRGCSDLKEVPGLNELTKLEVLDLSGTGINQLPPLDRFANLHQLLLKDCPNLKEFLGVKMLNLSGTIIENLRYGIPELTHLEQLDLPNMMSNQGAELNPDQWHISNLPDMLTEGKILKDCSCISVSSSTFLKLSETFREKIFKQFHLSVRPVEQQNRGGIHCYKDGLVFRGIYFQARCFSYFKEQERSLEICGFHHLPKGIEDILRCAEFLFLFDNSFVNGLHGLDSDNIKLVKGCWIERCGNMESVFNAKEGGDIAELGKQLEMLWLSNVCNLTSIYSGNLEHEGFRNLKHMYLDCCPKLSSVFSSSQPPINLETLHIKFCDNLKAVFDDNCVLPKLKTLHLLELPKLKSIGCMMPSLDTLIVAECSMLVNVLSPPQLPEDLTKLQIEGCDNLETVFENGTSAVYKLTKLSTLHLLELPRLKKIGAELPSQLCPKIRHCPKTLSLS